MPINPNYSLGYYPTLNSQTGQASWSPQNTPPPSWYSQPSGGQGGYAPMTMQSGGGGGSWLTNALGAGSGMAALAPILGITGPAGLGIGAGLSLLSGIIGGVAKGAKRSKYISEAKKLFPELSKESFMYKNPELTNAIQSGLGYRLSNMFTDWGMPAGRQEGAGSLIDIFKGLMTTPQSTKGKKGQMIGRQARGNDGWRQRALDKRPAYAV